MIGNQLSIESIRHQINSREFPSEQEASNSTLDWLKAAAMLQDEVGSFTIKLLFFNFSDIDVIEWHEFLTPQLKLSQLFKAKPKGDVSLPAYEFSSSIWKWIRWQFYYCLLSSIFLRMTGINNTHLLNI